MDLNQLGGCGSLGRGGLVNNRNPPLPREAASIHYLRSDEVWKIWGLSVQLVGARPHKPQKCVGRKGAKAVRRKLPPANSARWIKRKKLVNMNKLKG